MKSTNSTVANAIAARNAMLKMGDKVRFDGSPMQPSFGKEGRIVKIDKEYGDITIKADDGKTYTAVEEVVRKISNAMAAKNAPGMKSGIVKEFTEYSKAALGDIRRQCNDSLAGIKAQGKRLQEFAEKSGLSVEWSAIVDKGVIYVGVIQGILRDLDHAVSRY